MMSNNFNSTDSHSFSPASQNIPVPPSPRELHANVGEALAANLTLPQSAREFRFGHMDQFFPVQIVRGSGFVRVLPRGIALSVSDSVVDRYLFEHNLTALMVLENGEIRLERYTPSTNASTRWNGFSITKPVTDSLVGVALHNGVINSLADKITDYLPELHGSVYETVTLHQIMTMSSGVLWEENYTAPTADNVRLYAGREPLGESSTIAYMCSLTRAAPPGSVWNYNSGETDLVGVLLRRVTGQSLAAQLSDSIWKEAGMEHDATWIASASDTSGQAFGGSGLSATLRDWARLGQWFLEGGDSVLPSNWMTEAARSQMPSGQCPYGYGWWPQRNGAYAAIGIFGQSILIDPRRKLVIVTLGNCAEPTSTAHAFARNAFWRLVEAAVDKDASL